MFSGFWNPGKKRRVLQRLQQERSSAMSSSLQSPPDASRLPSADPAGEPPRTIACSEMVVLHQLEQHVESTRHTINVYLAWFAFACTINATTAEMVLKDKVQLHKTIIPWLFMSGGICAALISLMLIGHFHRTDQYVKRLLARVEGNLKSPLPTRVLMFIAGIVALIAIGVALGWAQYILDPTAYVDP